MSDKTTADRMNELLEAERSGIVAFEQMSFFSTNKDLNRVLAAIRNNEARNCIALHSLISRREVRPSDNINGFSDKLLALESDQERIELAIKGCSWTANKIAEFSEEELTDEERDFLMSMHKQHLWSIGVLRELLRLKEEGK